MKKVIIILTTIIFLSGFYGCGDNKNIQGKTYGTYGLINKDEIKNNDIEYHLIVGNIIWSCILIETIIAPIYFLGFSIYEPIGLKTASEKDVIK